MRCSPRSSTWVWISTVRGSRRRAAEQAVGRARVGYGEIGGGRACAGRCRADPSVGDRQRPGRGRASGSESQENEGTLEVSHESNSRDNESPSYRNVARGAGRWELFGPLRRIVH